MNYHHTIKMRYMTYKVNWDLMRMCAHFNHIYIMTHTYRLILEDGQFNLINEYNIMNQCDQSLSDQLLDAYQDYLIERDILGS